MHHISMIDKGALTVSPVDVEVPLALVRRVEELDLVRVLLVREGPRLVRLLFHRVLVHLKPSQVGCVADV